MKTVATIGVVISALVALLCLTVNVSTRDIGGVVGTIVLQQSTTGESVDQTRRVLRLVGVGWLCLGLLALVWRRRISRWEPYTFQRPRRGPRHPVLVRLGTGTVVAGMLGGLLFAAVVGSDSPTFHRNFVYFIGAYMMGTTLVLIGK